MFEQVHCLADPLVFIGVSLGQFLKEGGAQLLLKISGEVSDFKKEFWDELERRTSTDRDSASF